MKALKIFLKKLQLRQILTVEDASSFLKEKADEASARPELQKNPAVGR